jgi:hypothetical protein
VFSAELVNTPKKRGGKQHFAATEPHHVGSRRDKFMAQHLAMI